MAHARKENFAATGKVAAGSKQRVPKNGSECGRTGKKFEQVASSMVASGLARMTMMMTLLLLEPRWLQRVIDPLKPKVCARKMYKERGKGAEAKEAVRRFLLQLAHEVKLAGHEHR